MSQMKEQGKNLQNQINEKAEGYVPDAGTR